MTLGGFGFGTALVQAKTASQRWASDRVLVCARGGGDWIGSGRSRRLPGSRWLSANWTGPLVIAGGLTLFLFATSAASNALLTRSMSFWRHPGNRDDCLARRDGLCGRRRSRRGRRLGPRPAAGRPSRLNVRHHHRSGALGVRRSNSPGPPFGLYPSSHFPSPAGSPLCGPSAGDRCSLSGTWSGSTRSESGTSRWRSWSSLRYCSPLRSRERLRRVRTSPAMTARVWLRSG